MTEFEDEYSGRLEEDFRELEGALLSDTINTLSPTGPVCLRKTTPVREAVARVLAAGRAGS